MLQLISQLVGAPRRPAVKLKPRRRLGRQAPTLITEKDLISRESRIGSELFGPIPEGHERSFFCLDENTWVWNERWTDPTGHQQDVLIRYKIQGDRVLKTYNNQDSYLEGQELVNFRTATEIYLQRVRREVYQVETARLAVN